MPFGTRKKYQANFKARVAFQACKEQQTLQQIACEHQLSPTQVSQWKKQLKDGAIEIFSKNRPPTDVESITAPLYQQIGQLKVELDWLKKKSGL